MNTKRNMRAHRTPHTQGHKEAIPKGEEEEEEGAEEDDRGKRDKINKWKKAHTME